MADDKVHIPGVQEVVRNGKQNWQVMHAKKYLGFFSAFDDALKAKAQAMGMTSAQLTKMHMKSSKSQKSQTDSPQKCKGITRIIRGGRTMWQAQDTTNCAYIGTSDSAAGAAACLPGCVDRSTSQSHGLRCWHRSCSPERKLNWLCN